MKFLMLRENLKIITPSYLVLRRISKCFIMSKGYYLMSLLVNRWNFRKLSVKNSTKKGSCFSYVRFLTSFKASQHKTGHKLKRMLEPNLKGISYKRL